MPVGVQKRFVELVTLHPQWSLWLETNPHFKHNVRCWWQRSDSWVLACPWALSFLWVERNPEAGSTIGFQLFSLTR